MNYDVLPRTILRTATCHDVLGRTRRYWGVLRRTMAHYDVLVRATILGGTRTYCDELGRTALRQDILGRTRTYLDALRRTGTY
eukprot:4143968-Alexandrium_andersonii.AAC.1